MPALTTSAPTPVPPVAPTTGSTTAPTTATDPPAGSESPSLELCPVRSGPGWLDALRRAADGDDGDVPGWVLVTLMTAGLVLAIWAVAGPALTDLFTTAIDRVTTFGG